MQISDIKELLKQGESESLEFKKSTASLREIGMTLCAFLNSKGGKIIVGVSPSGDLLGQHVGDKTRQEISQVLNKIEPHGAVMQTEISFSDKLLIVFEAIPSEEKRPYVFDSRPYFRVGSSTSTMTQEHYQKLLLNRSGKSKRWEDEIVPEFTLADLDHDEILKTLRLGKEFGRIPEVVGSDIGDVLDRLDLRKKGMLVNAAMALFGINLRDYPHFCIRLARFRGNDKSEFIDEKQLKGHAFKILEEAEVFLDRHIPTEKWIPEDSIVRKEKPLYPKKALREALVNAICHRDYTIVGGAINIAIFDDSVEISSNGALPDGVSVEELKGSHKSVLRNPLIAETFYRRGVIEKWGRGTQQIVELCLESGLPEPHYEATKGFVSVNLYSKGLPDFSGTLSDLHREVLEIVYRQGQSALTEVLQLLSKKTPKRSVQRALSDLVENEYLEAFGQGKATYYKYIAK